jgi:hypothetical protein
MPRPDHAPFLGVSCVDSSTALRSHYLRISKSCFASSMELNGVGTFRESSPAAASSR